jgi:DNA topoisomerase-2
VIRKGEKQWITKGLYKWNDTNSSVCITELPVGQWTKDYKIFLDIMAQAESADAKTYDGKPILKSFDDLYNDLEVTFILYLDPDYYDDAKRKIEEFEKKFRLVSSWKTTNMCCFDADRNIMKYETIGDLLEDYYVVRLALYEKRKAYQLTQMEDHIEELSAKAKFIKGIVDGTIKIMNQTDEVVLASLKKHDLPPRSSPENPDSLDAYEYLLRMRIDRIKKSAVLEVEKELELTKQNLQELTVTPSAVIWKNELEQFQKAWSVHSDKVLKVMNPDKTTLVIKAKKTKK